MELKVAELGLCPRNVFVSKINLSIGFGKSESFTMTLQTHIDVDDLIETVAWRPVLYWIVSRE